VAKRRDIEVPRFKKMTAPPDVPADVLGEPEVEEHGAAVEPRPQVEQVITPSPRNERVSATRPRRDEGKSRESISIARPNPDDRMKNK
jgi:hypothetical protein